MRLFLLNYFPLRELRDSEILRRIQKNNFMLKGSTYYLEREAIRFSWGVRGIESPAAADF